MFKLATMMVLLVTASQAQARYDVVIRGGQVIDGTGAPRTRADLGIRGGRIVAVGELAAARGATEIDATGLFVVPGFVNLHSHASAAALPVAMNMLTQGVTTELLNADGGGPIDLATQLIPIEAGGLAVNVAASISEPKPNDPLDRPRRPPGERRMGQHHRARSGLGRRRASGVHPSRWRKPHRCSRELRRPSGWWSKVSSRFRAGC